MQDYHYIKKEDIENYISWLFNHNRSSAIIIIAMINKEISGFIAGDSFYYDKEQEEWVMNIHELVVKPNYRGLGIATHLIYEFISRSKIKNKQKNKKVNQVILWVGKDNKKAQKLYTNLGFSFVSKNNKWLKMRLYI